MRVVQLESRLKMGHFTYPHGTAAPEAITYILQFSRPTLEPTTALPAQLLLSRNRFRAELSRNKVPRGGIHVDTAMPSVCGARGTVEA